MTNKRILDIDGILARIPHRYPFLLIDRVDDWRENDYLLARKCVTCNENFFQGHFPSYMVMPGVLQIEMVAQAAALLAVLGEGTGSDDIDVRFVKVEEARFQKEVRPGDVLEIYVQEIRRKGNFRWGKGVITVGSDKVVTVSMVAQIVFLKKHEASK